MDPEVEEFLKHNHRAVMTTIKRDGSPHVARVGVGLVEGKLWSSGTKTRARTQHLRRDPRAALAVLGEDGYNWLGIESLVTIHEGDDAPQKNLALYRVLAAEPDDLDEYLEAMVKEQRLIFEFSIERTYR
ncbi:MAG: TIGR03618 family F420-dependent PPOX class oxidoreductase [Actinomycetota bacterium]|nr:TIGR03618 family F420-dependent PPOX class oxidoreductase [Actinomycetota bacterium]